MANHISSEKRARQTIKRADRNTGTRSRVRRAEKALRDAISGGDKTKIQESLSSAFRTIQKSKSALHPNAIRRKMARLSKAAHLKTQAG